MSIKEHALVQKSRQHLQKGVKTIKSFSSDTAQRLAKNYNKAKTQIKTKTKHGTSNTKTSDTSKPKSTTVLASVSSEVVNNRPSVAEIYASTEEEVLGPRKADDNTILALDIGTEFVKAVIARRVRGNELEIVGVGRAQQMPSNMHAGAIADITGVIATCEQALSEAERQVGVIARQAVVGIAGELIKGNTSTVRYKRKNGNKPISEVEMTGIIEKVQAQAGRKARREVALETDNPDVEVRLINSAIVALAIDGYKVSNPIGFKGSELTIQFYTAFAPLVHISAIEKVCTELNLELIAVAVEPFAVCRACLGDNLDSGFSAIVMDIGGGTTDIAVVNDGGVEGTKMFSIGGRSFTHRIAEKLGIDFNAAEKIKLEHDNINLSIHTQQKVETAIAENLTVWSAGIVIALEDFDLSEHLPTKIYLCGGGASLPELQEYLATQDWYKELPFTRRPVIHLIGAEDIPGITYATTIKNATNFLGAKDGNATSANWSGAGLDYSYATALGLLRVALDTMIDVPEGTGLRAKIAKILQN